MTTDTRAVSIGFIGAGVLGRGLALALDDAGCPVAAVSSRTPSSARWLAGRIDGCRAADTAQAVADRCDLVFITTPDAAIAEVAAAVSWRAGQGVAHCCGAASTELLAPAARAGASVGAMHPYQTFAALAEPEAAARRLSGVTFAIAADGWLSDYLPTLAARLGGRAVVIPDELRPLYHASAVLACGYVATLLDAAISIWSELAELGSELGPDLGSKPGPELGSELGPDLGSELGPDLGSELGPDLGSDADAAQDAGLNAVIPLARATLDAIAAAGPRPAATGPAMRGDANTVAAHLAALEQHAPHLAPLYRELTRASLPLARAKGVPAEALAALARQLGGRLDQSLPAAIFWTTNHVE